MTTVSAPSLDRPLFSSRYGWSHHPDAPPWAVRHKNDGRDPRAPHPCRCPGSRKTGTTCKQSATQEDILCDECRNYCVAVDSGHRYHHIADLPDFPR